MVDIVKKMKIVKSIVNSAKTLAGVEIEEEPPNKKTKSSGKWKG